VVVGSLRDVDEAGVPVVGMEIQTLTKFNSIFDQINLNFISILMK